ncbi:hypothetical protein WR30_26115 [Burkholderia contaminans FFH2055]|uniref:DUF1828 domain-containing protein n=1 Tax=Burkholderia contaminans TaxID=488447 RepID=UPI000626AAC7|nr:DUF1828 domain-containing protein [Burkholderia contaminans]KKL34011.1 hypothetical protein WR30_26115 [Burkholderia contaminans FFH2055]MEB4632200.1 DUF1828 domain-containing protein [Burkholderia contaminans]MEB4639651.1 DUF1828 domain-containing protein [Burkholderia contaminans]MEB4654307.1 DUF1828 domain-containing protein [Burkholderia contaminans]MEB4663404.1 DUF1828 domain-containing protein [Burkholderia contaminans]
MNIDCAWLHKRLAYDCRPVKTVNGERAFEIGTPFSFADGSAIVFYVIEQGSHSLISDNGDTLFHLSSTGIDPFNGRRLSTLRHLLAQHGMSVEANGEIRSLGPVENTSSLVAGFIAGLLALTEQERTWAGVPESVNNLADDVERYLRILRPDQPIIRNPKVKGISNHEYAFQFMWGSELVDVLSPSPQATGGLMRKLGDVLSAPGEPPKIRVVIDDRGDLTKAETEKQIIGSMASAMLYSALAKAAKQPTLH